MGAMLLGIAVPSVVSAKPPIAEDEAQVRSIIEKVYASYSRPIPEAPEDGSYAPENAPGAAMDDYEPPYTATLGPLAKRWGTLMRSTEELYRLNSFDWYCQCQDNDNKTAKMLRQTYTLVGKDRIDANILYSPGRSDQGDSGAPLLFRFKREAGIWKLDDLKFHKFSTLRKALAKDIQEAEKDLAAK
jgi:hypothetical protein